MTAAPERWAGQAEMLVNRVRKNQRRLRRWLASEGVTCYRIYDRDIPELPLAIDWYEGRIHAALLSRGDWEEERPWGAALLRVLAEALGVGEDGVFLKERRIGKGGGVYSPLGRRGARVEVGEGGLRFLVNMTDHLDTGLFLDHRITRRMVRDEARGKRFLNLFAYTGSFSVYAAAGGAQSTTTVDLSNTYLDWARDNLELNGFTGASHRWVREDVLGALESGRVVGRYDLAVIDPPTVSKSKGMARDLEIQRDHAAIINGVLERMTRGGAVYFSTNFNGFRMDDASIRSARVEEISDRTIPPDFTNGKIHRCWRIVR